MNTRLQVEHPVTELVTGRDLVADQLADRRRRAARVRRRRTSAPRGHAIEVRLYAEDAEAGFLPATGRVEALALADRRRASGSMPGSSSATEVGGRFDPMLAKIIAWGRTAARRSIGSTAALDETVVLGLVDEPAVPALARPPAGRPRRRRRGPTRSTAIWPPDDWARAAAIPDEAWTAAAAALTDAEARCERRPWAGGWRLNGPALDPARGRGDRANGRRSRRRRSAVAAGELVAAVRVGDTVHVDVAGRSVAFALAPPPDVERRRRGRGAAGDRGGGRSDARRPDARRRPGGPRRGRRRRRGRRPGRHPRGDEDGARRSSRRSPGRVAELARRARPTRSTRGQRSRLEP